MYNMIKMNLYRAFHQKAFYIVPLSMAIVACLMVWLVWMAPRLEQAAYETSGQSDFSAGFHAGFTTGSVTEEPIPVLEEFNLTDFMDELFGSGILGILISVGAAIIANSERKHGYIKNIAGQIPSRGMLVLAKLPALLLESLLILIFAALGFALAGRILFEKFVFGSPAGFARAFAVQLFLSLALCALILMICTLAGNAASGIITGIVLSAGILSFLYGMINKVLWRYLHVPESFDITDYTLSTRLMSVFSASDTKTLIHGLVIGAVYLAVCSAGACMIIRRKDIS